MKNFFLLIFLGWMSLSVANSSDPNVTQNKKLDYETCLQFDSDQKMLKQNPGFYYFRSGICRLTVVHDAKSFNELINKFNQSSSANNYPLSYFVLGLLFQQKYKLGSEYYGVKGKPSDLLEAVKNYEKAAQYGSSLAENAPFQLPDINKALYWLTLSAHHGNSAAQGTLSDLNKQGIGIPQNYVQAYVWENLSVASWVRFDKQPQDKVGHAR